MRKLAIIFAVGIVAGVVLGISYLFAPEWSTRQFSKVKAATNRFRGSKKMQAV